MKKRIAIIIALALIIIGVFFASRALNVKAPLPESSTSGSDAVQVEESSESKEPPSTLGMNDQSVDVNPENATESEDPLIVANEDDSQAGTIISITPDTAWTAWDDFLALSPEEQDAFMHSFENLDAFTEWMVAAQKEWAAAHPTEEIGPGDVIHIG